MSRLILAISMYCMLFIYFVLDRQVLFAACFALFLAFLCAHHKLIPASQLCRAKMLALLLCEHTMSRVSIHDQQMVNRT